MDPDGPRVGKPFVFAVAGETESIIMVCFDQLGPAGAPMWIMTIGTEDPCNKVAALLKVEPLLMMGFRMSLWISPDSRLKLVIVG
jgi:hypothetical protein